MDQNITSFTVNKKIIIGVADWLVAYLTKNVIVSPKEVGCKVSMVEFFYTDLSSLLPCMKDISIYGSFFLGFIAFLSLLLLPLILR